MGVDMGKAVFRHLLFKGGSQIMNAHRMAGLGPQMQGYPVKANVFDQTGLFSINQDAIFTLAEDIAETDIANMTHLHLRLAGKSGNGDGFGLPPEHGLKQPGGNGDILEDHIFNTAGVPQLERNAPIAVADGAIVDPTYGVADGAFKSRSTECSPYPTAPRS